MNWYRLAVVACALAVADASATQLQAEETRYSVGAAKVDITPDYPVLLSGYAGRSGMATEVSQRLYARALAISNSDQATLIMIAVDNCGVPQTVTQKVADALHEQHGIDRSQLVVCSTHTHNAPMLSGVLPNLFVRDFEPAEQQAIERYTEELGDTLIMAARQALEKRQPAELAWGEGVVSFAYNRRNSDGPVAHRLPVLRASTPEGKTLAIVVNYACHAVALGSGNFLGGDWPGYAAELLEAEYPEATALVVIGCGADQNPVQRGGMTAARDQGVLLARETQRVLSQTLRPITGQVETDYQQIAIPFAAPPTLEQWEQRAQTEGIAGYHAAKQLAKLKQGQPLRSELDYPILTWSFGKSLAMVFLGGEVVVDYARLLETKFDSTRLWVTAYSNDVPCYIPSQRVLKEGGYEGEGAMVWYDQPGPLATGVERRILDEVARQLDEDFRSELEVDVKKTGGTPPLSPAESMATMRTHDEFRIELVASEPLVIDPVAIDFGPDGKLWVAEMHDYPEGLDGAYTPGGRVKYLEDIDQNGRYDKATVLIDGLPFPTGVLAWREGVLVCAAPDVIYVEDSDGDGRADVQRKVLTGFATHNYQARVNSLALGLDNWIYGAGGLFGGMVETPEGTTADVNNRDFRLRPDSGQIEAVSGRTQQGRARDDWGNWFGCTNGGLLLHYPVTDHYYARNPHVAAPPPEVGAAPSNRIYPRGELVQFALSGPAGVATSACGLGIYRDTKLGEAYSGNSFVCEPVNQLVHRLIIQPSGTTFRGQRAADEQQTEFLTSTDNWFRPVQARTGPDGALWVVDIYRYVIEHPRWIADEVKAQLDVRAGDQRGRIYRIVPRTDTSSPVPPDLRALDIAALVEKLNTPNGVVRDLAHLELLWRNDAAAVEPLKQVACNASLPQARLHALCLVQALQAESPALILQMLGDAHPGVRRQAVRLAEPHLATNDELRRAVIQRADDADIQVRLQVAYSLGEVRDASTGPVLARMALAASGDPYVVGAVLSSLNEHNVGSVVAAMYRESDPASNPLLSQVLTLAAAVGGNDSLSEALDVALAPAPRGYQTWQYVAIPGIWQTLQARQLTLDPEQRAALLRIVDAARQTVADDNAPSEARRVAAGVLIIADDSENTEDVSRLAEWLQPQEPFPMQQTAVETLGKMKQPGAARALLERWRQMTPALQALTLDALLAREAATQQLLDFVEQQVIPVAQIDATRRQVLLNSRNEAIKERAGRLFEAPSGEEVARLLKAYGQVDLRSGDARRGREVFGKHCATCHRLDGQGHEVGPNLTALTDKSPGYLLTAVLDPNRAIDQRYAAYAAATADGQVLTGLLVSEAAGSVTLKSQDGKEHVILRNDLEELANTGKSYMPEGLAREIPPADMSDLLAYVSAGGLKASYRYSSMIVPDAIYPDDAARPKLTDGLDGGERFDNGQWVGFRPSGAGPAPRILFDLTGQLPEGADQLPLRSLRITYGVNHAPGGIHAPNRVLVALSSEGVTYGRTIEFSEFDDTADGRGTFELARRTAVIPLDGQPARFVRVDFHGNAEWIFLAEVELQGGAAEAAATGANEQ